MNHERLVIELISSDITRMHALHAVASLRLPDWLIAAGFVRNAIWDYLFDKKTPLNDADVIYYCADDLSPERDRQLEKCLQAAAPYLPWSVKNQARMHLRNGDARYLDTLDAMSYWPEKQTCVGIRISGNGDMQLRHCFPLSLQFNGRIDRNPRRSLDVFNQRIQKKEWLATWPALKIER
jgi:hypothetical protein